jgi:hypothetical protein
MKSAVTERKGTGRTVVSQGQHRGATYSKVMDKRKRPIRGLWERNGRYYAQLTVEDQVTGIKQVKRAPMEGVSTDAQAIAKLQELLTQRRKGSLPILKRTPLFADYAKQYFDYYEKVKDAKRESTITRKKSSSTIGLSTWVMQSHEKQSRRPLHDLHLAAWQHFRGGGEFGA